MAYSFLRWEPTMGTYDDFVAMAQEKFGSDFLTKFSGGNPNFSSNITSYVFDLIKSENEKGTIYIWVKRNKDFTYVTRWASVYDKDGNLIYYEIKLKFKSKEAIVDNIDYALAPFADYRIGSFPGLFIPPAIMSNNYEYLINGIRLGSCGDNPSSSSANILYQIE